MKIVCVMLMVFVLFGACTSEGDILGGEEGRFLVEHTTSDWAGTIRVIVDLETGVKYLWCKDGYGAGLTVMPDAD